MSILDDAKHLVNTDRNAAYGHPLQDFQRVAVIWSGILNQLVTPEQVGQCLIGLKLARHCYQSTRDSLVDIAGYAECLDLIAQAKEPPCPPQEIIVPTAEPCCAQSEDTSPVPTATPSPSAAVRESSEICPSCQMFLPKHQDSCPQRPVEHQEMGMEGL